MESWIAGAMAVLGTLLVLAGGTLIVLRTLGRIPGLPDSEERAPSEAPTLPYGGTGRPEGPPRRRWRLSPANQLLAWGVVLLVLASLAAGLITFEIGLATGAR